MRKAFTLIELLVVIVIIGVLATLAVVAVNGARTKARDSKRISDIKQIQTALELYMADENTYPSLITPGQPMVGLTSGKTYMSKVPNNPNPKTEGDCPDSDYGYAGNDSNYVLTYCLNNRATQATTSVNVASNKVTNGAVAEYPVSATYYCDSVHPGWDCFSRQFVPSQLAIYFDNNFNIYSYLDAWGGEYVNKGINWDFGSSKNRTVNIKWKASIRPYPNVAEYFKVNIDFIFETSPNNTNWTTQKTLNYVRPAGSDGSIIMITDQLEVFSGNFQYFRVRMSSASDVSAYAINNAFPTDGSYLAVDGIVSY